VKAVAGAAVGVFLVPVLFIAAAVGGLDAGAGLDAPGVALAQRAAIPPAILALYEEAGAAHGVAPGLLAAVGKVECDHGRDLRCAFPNAAGAAGPMQFLPATWARYAEASGNPRPSVYDRRDAIHAAAAKLAADGAGADAWAALRSYNPSDAYAASVLAWGLAYGWQPPDEALLARAALSHPRLGLRPDAAADVAAARVDARVLAVLLVAATTYRLERIGPLTRHHPYVRGTTRLSNHIFGRAVDIFAVDGLPVTAANAAAEALLQELLALPAPLRPDEIGCPWPEYEPLPGVFSDGDHRDHLHLGWRAAS
jgi:hypothetical protein